MKISEVLNSKGLKMGSLGSVAIKFLGTLFTFLISILLARYLGIDNYGVYVLAFSTVMLLSIPLTLGLPLLLTRYIPKYEVENNYGAIKGLLKKTNQMTFLSYAAILIVCVAIYFISPSQYSALFVETFLWGLLLLPIMGFSAIRAASLQGMRYIILGQLPDALLRNLFLFSGILGYYLITGAITAPEAMMIHVVSACISYVIGFYFLKIKLLNRLKDVTPIYHTKKWLSHSLQFSLNMGINNIKTRIATYMLAYFSGTAAVALFEVAFKGANLVSYALTALNSAIAPHLSKTFEENNPKRLQQIVTKASRVIFICSIPVALIFILGGEYVIETLYGLEYKDSYIPLAILCGAQLINSFAGSVGLLLNMTGHHSYVLRVNLFNTLFNIVIAIPLIMYFDVIGASLAYAALLVVQNTVLVWYAHRKMNINTTVL